MSTAIGIQILYDAIYKSIDFFEINSAAKGNGTKMVEAFLKDFKKDWQPAVLMDFARQRRISGLSMIKCPPFPKK